MSFNTDWDVDKYKSEFDAEDHWNLRRSFLLAHKDKYPEEKLICLAQVFYNIEFYGCRYPEKTMKIVEELSRDIAADHRAEKKNKLQRTFVTASDAAGARVKGTKRKHEDNLSRNNTAPTFVSRGKSTNEFLAPSQNSTDSEALQTIEKLKRLEGPCGPMYVMLTEDQPSMNNLQRTASAWKMPFNHKLDFIEVNKNSPQWRCTALLYNVTAVTEGPVKTQTRLAAFDFTIWKLQQHYYTLKLPKFFSREKLKEEQDSDEADVQKSDILGTPIKEQELSDDNVGMKLLKMMGWEGGGLGKNQQGIEKPVEATGNVIKRAGLGCDNKFDSKKIRNLLLDFQKCKDKQDLKFANDFTNEERSIIHKVARSLGLKSKSVGSKTNRQLYVSKAMYNSKMDPWEFMKFYLTMKFKYFKDCELIPPKTLELEKLEGVKYL